MDARTIARIFSADLPSLARDFDTYDQILLTFEKFRLYLNLVQNTNPEPLEEISEISSHLTNLMNKFRMEYRNPGLSNNQRQFGLASTAGHSGLMDGNSLASSDSSGPTRELCNCQRCTSQRLKESQAACQRDHCNYCGGTSSRYNQVEDSDSDSDPESDDQLSDLSGVEK